jgi:hypothetical protein
MTDVIPGSPATATLRRRLTELGETGRTGALHIGGRPGGVLYLVGGRITDAETPACPGLGDRPARFVPGERHWLGDMTTQRLRGVPQRLRGVPQKRKPVLR